MDYHGRYSNRSRKSDSFGIPKRRRRGPVVLEDFELIRVLGKGCAGRVSLFIGFVFKYSGKQAYQSPGVIGQTCS